MPGRLEGKVALVTGQRIRHIRTSATINTDRSPGAGSGFGAAIAERFAQEGCNVVLADINVKGAQGVVEKIQGLKLNDTNGESFQALQMDVTKEEDWKNAVQLCIEKWARLDCLVNNAGTTYKNKV